MKKQKEKQQKKQHDLNRGKENNCFYPSEKEAKKQSWILDRECMSETLWQQMMAIFPSVQAKTKSGRRLPGVSKGFMNKKMLVKVDLQGNVLEGTHKPSSELKMHLRAYQENPDLRSVCHAHPPICTSFSIAGIPLDVPVLAEAVITLGDVPIAPYAELGTKEVAEVIAPYCHTHNGVLLANHGAVTWAEDAYAAYYRLESMEYYANILMITGKILGKQNCFTKEQVDRLIAMREKFGISRGGVPRTEKED